MNITKATVILGIGADIVILHTDLPSSMPKIDSQQLTLKFDAEYDAGAEYVRKQFGIEPEVVSTRIARTKFTKDE